MSAHIASNTADPVTVNANAAKNARLTAIPTMRYATGRLVKNQRRPRAPLLAAIANQQGRKFLVRASNRMTVRSFG